jgi:hypothetical protein
MSLREQWAEESAHVHADSGDREERAEVSMMLTKPEASEATREGAYLSTEDAAPTEDVVASPVATGAWRLRLAFSTVVALGLSSCVTPTCWKYLLVGMNSQHLASVSIFSEPLQSPALDPSRFGFLHVWFGHQANIVVHDRGGMMTTDESSWPEGCGNVPAEELAAVSRSWASVIERRRATGSGGSAGDRMTLDRMDHLYTGEDWRPYGPLISISFGRAESGFGLLWDGQAYLAEDLDAAVMRTLEMVCSNGRNARRILLRDLPPQVVARLECARQRG